MQTVLAATGPTLRKPLLDRLVDRGDLRCSTRKTLGIIDTGVLEYGGSGHRDVLLAQVRAVLVDGAEPMPRVAAVAALIYGSGTLPQFHRDIPWTAAVVERAESLKTGSSGAGAAVEAVACTVTATIVNSVVMSTVVLPRT